MSPQHDNQEESTMETILRTASVTLGALITVLVLAILIAGPAQL